MAEEQNTSNPVEPDGSELDLSNFDWFAPDEQAKQSNGINDDHSLSVNQTSDSQAVPAQNHFNSDPQPFNWDYIASFNDPFMDDPNGFYPVNQYPVNQNSNFDPSQLAENPSQADNMFDSFSFDAFMQGVDTEQAVEGASQATNQEDLSNVPLPTYTVDEDDEYEDVEEEDEDDQASQGSADNKRKGYATPRKLIRWNLHQDQLLVLVIEYECNRLGIQLPWPEIARHFQKTARRDAPLQHLMKVRRARVWYGLPIPPELRKARRVPKPKVGAEIYRNRVITEKDKKVYEALVSERKDPLFEPMERDPTYTEPDYTNMLTMTPAVTPASLLNPQPRGPVSAPRPKKNKGKGKAKSKAKAKAEPEPEPESGSEFENPKKTNGGSKKKTTAKKNGSTDKTVSVASAAKPTGVTKSGSKKKSVVDASTPVVKRGRGRPRKNPIPGTQVTQVQNPAFYGAEQFAKTKHNTGTANVMSTPQNPGSSSTTFSGSAMNTPTRQPNSFRMPMPVTPHGVAYSAPAAQQGYYMPQGTPTATGGSMNTMPNTVRGQSGGFQPMPGYVPQTMMHPAMMSRYHGPIQNGYIPHNQNFGNNTIDPRIMGHIGSSNMNRTGQSNNNNNASGQGNRNTGPTTLMSSMPSSLVREDPFTNNGNRTFSTNDPAGAMNQIEPTQAQNFAQQPQQFTDDQYTWFRTQQQYQQQQQMSNNNMNKGFPQQNYAVNNMSSNMFPMQNNMQSQQQIPVASSQDTEMSNYTTDPAPNGAVSNYTANMATEAARELAQHAEFSRSIPMHNQQVIDHTAGSQGKGMPAEQSVLYQHMHGVGIQNVNVNDNANENGNDAAVDEDNDDDGYDDEDEGSDGDE